MGRNLAGFWRNGKTGIRPANSATMGHVSALFFSTTNDAVIHYFALFFLQLRKETAPFWNSPILALFICIFRTVPSLCHHSLLIFENCRPSLCNLACTGQPPISRLCSCNSEQSKGNDFCTFSVPAVEEDTGGASSSSKGWDCFPKTYGGDERMWGWSSACIYNRQLWKRKGGGGGRQREFKDREKKRGGKEELKKQRATLAEDREAENHWEREEITLGLSYSVEPGFTKTLRGFWKSSQRQKKRKACFGSLEKRRKLCHQLHTHLLQDPQVWVWICLCFNICKAAGLGFFVSFKNLFLLLFRVVILHQATKLYVFLLLRPELWV